MASNDAVQESQGQCTPCIFKAKHSAHPLEKYPRREERAALKETEIGRD
jgi:hypothetical protein